MSSADTLRVSTETLESLQLQLRQICSQLETRCSAVNAITSRITEEAGSDIRVPLNIRLSVDAKIGSGDVKTVLERCRSALQACAVRSNRLSGAVAKVSDDFVANEKAIAARFSGSSSGETSGLENGGAAAGAQGAQSGEESGVMAWLRENMPWMADLMKVLLSLGDDAETIFGAIMAGIRALGKNMLSAQAIASTHMTFGQFISSSSANALLKEMSGLAIAAFVMNIGAGIISDVSAGLPADRVLTNVLANTLLSAATIVGGAVLGDGLATLVMGGLAMIPGLQPALPLISFVVYPVCNIAMTKGIEALLSLEIGGKPMTDYVKDAFYDAYKGIGESVQRAGEALSTVSDMLQSGAEFVQDTVNDGIEFVQETVNEGIDFVQATVNEGIEFVQDTVNDGIEFVQDTVSDAAEFVDSLFPAPSVSWLFA